MDVLTIRVSAPLQSYGNQATFNRRTTNYYPTKSAVIGLVAASLGLRREDDHIQRLNQLEYAVRIDQVGLMMTDFQTVETDPQKETRKITYREYLQDYVYAIAIGSRDKELIQTISYALLHPKFQLYWGRRSNPPAGILQVQIFEDTEPIAVLTYSLPWQASPWYQRKLRKDTFEAELIADSALLPQIPCTMTKDLVGSFDQRNRYHVYRGVAKTRVTLQNPWYQEHDIMAYL